MKTNGYRSQSDNRISITRTYENTPSSEQERRNKVGKVKVKTHTVKSKSKKPFPVGLVIILVILTVLLMMCVSNYVTLNEYTREVSDLRQELDTLKSEEKKLNSELDRKYDLVEIEKYAKDELGLMGSEDVDKKYIDVKDDEKIEVYEVEEDGTMNAVTDALFALADNLLKSWNNLLGNE